MESLLSYSDLPSLLPIGLAWAEMDSRSTDVLAGLCVGGAVVPVRLRIDYSRARLSGPLFVDEVERCIDAERAMLVGSF